MPDFPAQPWTNGEETTDGLLVYVDPPGVWRSTGNTDGHAIFTAEHEAAIELAQTSLASIVAELGDVSARLNRIRTQITPPAEGDTPIDLDDGTFIHIPGTVGTWTPVFTNVPVDGVEIYLSVIITDDDDELVITGSGVWKEGTTAPVTADFNGGDEMVFRIVKLPNVDSYIYEWLLDGIAPDPDPTVTPVTMVGHYSTNSDLSSPQLLEGATLPAGTVYVFFSPADNSDISSLRLFSNHTGSIPAVGEEGDSFIGTFTTPPWVLTYDTNVDPTGNNRPEHDDNGENTITAVPLYIDAQESDDTFTFDTDNEPIGSDPTRTHISVGYGNALTPTTVPVPDGVDRLVLVKAGYTVSGSAQAMTGMTLNGVAMTEITNATRDPGDSQGLGVYTAWLDESDLSTGDLVLQPAYASSPASWSAIVYEIDVYTNMASLSLVGDEDYDNVGPTVGATQAPSVSSPANAYLSSSSFQQQIATDPTVDLGTPSTVTEVPSSPSLQGRSSVITDSGAAATETFTWTTVGRSVSVLVAIGYSASGGGSGETPIIPAVPVISSVSNSGGDNRLTVTWGAAANAVSYESRLGTTNPPATIPAARSSLSFTATGLAAGVVHYVQIRSVSSTGDRSAWSTAGSGTPTGSVTPPPTFSGKFLVSSNHVDVMMGEGYGTPNFSNFWTQRGFVRVNPAPTEWDVANITRNANFDRAIGNWNARNGISGAARTFRNNPDVGPRLIVTGRLGAFSDAGQIGARQNSTASAAQKAAAIADVGKSGSTGSINRNSTWLTLANNINRTYNGWNLWEHVFYSVAHESFGSWAYDYGGRNTALIGQPALTGATNAQYGSAMGAALRYAGETGDCSAVHKLACERIIDILWSVNPNIIIGMTPNDGRSSDITGLEASNLGSTWVRAGFPDRPLDFICPTTYLRGSNQTTYLGGDIDDVDNWLFRGDAIPLQYAEEYVNDIYGCAFGLLEMGGNYAVPSGPYNAQASTGDPRTIATPGDNDSQSDQEMFMWNKKIIETVLPRYDNGLAFINWWNFLDWVGSNHENGCSFNIFEGMWGWHPKAGTQDQYVNIPAGSVGYLPTSTGKPNWSSVSSNTRYPKTLGWFTEQFAVGA